jgi:hypothetical protein
VREGVGHHDGQAARTRAQFQDLFDGIRVGHPGAELLGNEFGDERARHDHAFVHIEGVGAQPGLVGDVGGRYALDDTALEHGQYAVHFLGQQARVKKRLEAVERQVQGVQNEVGRFVVGFGAAMAEKQLGLVKARYGKAQQVARRGKWGSVHGVVQ